VNNAFLGQIGIGHLFLLLILWVRKMAAQLGQKIIEHPTGVPGR
jgi:hypothetical protein